jgi:hypothetical protein
MTDAATLFDKIKLALTEEDTLHINASLYAAKRKRDYYSNVGKDLGTRLDPATYGWVYLAHIEAFKAGYESKLVNTDKSSKLDEFRGECHG